MAFTLDDIVNQSKKQRTGTERKLKVQVQMIHYTKLHKSAGQFYNENDIEELAEAIRLGNGVKQPLLVKKKDTAIGEYEVISGHRRRLACIYLVETMQLEEYSFLPCIVSKDDSITDRLNLILTNKTQRRKLSTFELIKETNELEKIFAEMEEQTGEKITARERRKVKSEILGISQTRVANLQSIDKNLIAEGKERLKDGSMSVSVATELSGLSEETQQELMKKKENISIKDVKEAKKEEKNVSDSDTKLGTEEMPEGQVEISDYNGIAPCEFSRAEKLEAIKEALACLAYEKERAENIIHEFDHIDDSTRMILAKYTAKKEAFELYIKYLRSEIRE